MKRAFLPVFAVVLAAVLASATRPVWTLDPDAAAYLGLGRALASGAGYTLDAASATPHAKYPPGWPWILSLLVRLGGPEAYRLFHLALVAMLAAAAGASGILVRRLGYPAPVAFAVGACVGLSQTLFDLSVVYLRTEVPFLLLVTGALAVLARPGPAAGDGPREVAGAGWIASALLVMAACATRLAGVALLAIPAWRLVRPGADGGSRRRSAALLAVGLAVPLLWSWRAAHIAATHPQAPDYSRELLAAEPRDLTKVVRVDMPTLDGPALARRVLHNAEVLARASATLLTNVDRAAHRLPVGLALLALLAAGGAALVAAGGARRDVGLFLGATVALYLVWPFDQQERFYAPVLPALLLAGGEGATLAWALGRRAARSPAGRRVWGMAGAALVLVLAAQRSDHPVVLGRWSAAYAGMLAAVATAWLVTLRWTATGRWPLPGPAAWCLVPLLFALPFGARRFVDWPARVERFEQHRAAHPVGGPLERIDVHPLLEQVALRLREAAAPDDVVMTDVPKMMSAMTGLRCVPFVYGVAPPQVLAGDATWVFYTGELDEAARVMASSTAGLLVDLPVRDESGAVLATLYRVPP